MNIKLSIEDEAIIASRLVNDAGYMLTAIPPVPGLEGYTAGRRDQFDEAMTKMAAVVDRWRASRALKNREAA